MNILTEFVYKLVPLNLCDIAGSLNNLKQVQLEVSTILN